MQTKILIIVGVSVASVVALFVMGFFLDKDASKKEKAGERKENTNPPSHSWPSGCTFWHGAQTVSSEAPRLSPVRWAYRRSSLEW